METPTPNQRAMALKIKEWLPRPVWIHKPGEMSGMGPGALELRKYNIMGYSAIHTISEGRPTRSSQFKKLEQLFKLMSADHVAPIANKAKDKDDETAEILSRIPDLGELEERLDALRAVQTAQGHMLLEVKTMLEKLLKELGVK